MPATVLEILEFDHVRELLAEQCQFSLGSERALELGPSSQPDTAEYLLDVTSEATLLLETRPGFGVGGARDIRAHLERAEIGSMLTPGDLLEVLDTVAASLALRRSFFRIEDRSERFPLFSEFISHVAELPGLDADIRRSISEHGDVLDSASEELGRVRRQLRSAQSRAAERIRRYTQHPDYATALQEPIVTTRDGRFVVPVRADRRSQLPGMVHDTSASGQTLFVEPAELIELNNRVRELEAAERHEVERILRWLTSRVASSRDDLLATLGALSAVDLALAKAKLASTMRATRANLVDRDSANGRRIALSQARHPLLPDDGVVPIDVVVGGDYRVLVITGPNTGGKTVALKTVGLLALMTQAGLFIPADEGSEMPVFDGVFADIGDEQSIEQSLSTFSSHMVRVISALGQLTDRSLALFDELGAGTDPEEGSALARAIIERLLDVGCLAIATTHYSELKTFAYTTEGAENASVEFDLATLSPTYRLEIGIPGRSNALAIASRLGMPEDVLERARGYIDPQAERADVLISEIRSRRAEAEQALRDAERRREEAEQRLAEAEERRARAEREALADIEQELGEARDRIRRLRQLPERMERDALRETRRQAQEELGRAAAQIRRASRERVESQPVRQQLQVGDTVELLSIGGEGEVIGFSPDGLEAEIQMGAFKLSQPVRDLKLVGRKGGATQQAPRVRAPAPAQRVDMELHLRGQRAAGIEPILDEYLDDAYLSHYPFVRIIHGKGTGALREAVREVLRRHPLVRSFETPPENEGGEGVTVAYLKEA